MKKCKVLMGPIAVGDRHYKEGETVELTDTDANCFASWKYAEILPEPKKETKPPADPPANPPANPPEGETK